MDLGEFRAIFGPGFAGAVFGAGCWFLVEAVVCSSVEVSFLHYLPGIFASLAALMFNTVNKEDLDDSPYGESEWRVKLWLFIAYVVSFVSLAASVGLLIQDELVKSGPSAWTGVAGVFQCVVILIRPLLVLSIRLLGLSIFLNAMRSESPSFTSSNDDDSSSTTTEPTSNVSPNGRFRRIIMDWHKGELLGRGSLGSVYEGIADDGFFFAVKEVSLLDQGEEGRQSIIQLEQEIALLSQFEHENIVQYYGATKDESKLYIFLELVTKGSLLSLYQKYNLQDSQVSAYTRQILHGLKYLHDRDVVHRDIKCANILVDAKGSVKLADFGLAKATELNGVKSCKGTAFWMAPEVVRNRGYGHAADIWSLGCTVLEMLTRRFPYFNLECMSALFRIGKGERPPIPESLSSYARAFILQCLQVDPNARPTAAQLLDHPFVKRPLSSSSRIVSREIQ